MRVVLLYICCCRRPRKEGDGAKAATVSQVRIAPPFSSRIMKQPLAEVKVRTPCMVTLFCPHPLPESANPHPDSTLTRILTLALHAVVYAALLTLCNWHSILRFSDVPDIPSCLSSRQHCLGRSFSCNLACRCLCSTHVASCLRSHCKSLPTGTRTRLGTSCCAVTHHVRRRMRRWPRRRSRGWRRRASTMTRRMCCCASARSRRCAATRRRGRRSWGRAR